ncbi:CPBP family intramembrane glutamic endopeptidase [Loktanella agnita]|uniref:CPBP family intramembrane glutamic endopeptidase n=1 Tax=Loktanella agnita TaxID=287097 RepID=UPI003986210A
MFDRPTAYAAHADFIRPAMARTEMWRLIVMIICFEIAFIVTPWLMMLALPPRAEEAYIEGVTAFGTLAQFASFGIITAIFVWTLRRVHERGFWSLVGQADAAVVNMIRVMCMVGLVLLAKEIFPPWYDLSALAETRNLLRWLVLLPFGFVVLLIQVSTEELYFRGYLQQQFACMSESRLVWMGLPSFMFGMAHYFNGIGEADGILWALWAMALGLACADLTARTGNIGAAVGLHLANNAFALLIYGMMDWPTSGLALFLFPFDDPYQYDLSIDALRSAELIMPFVVNVTAVWVMWLAARLAIRR